MSVDGSAVRPFKIWQPCLKCIATVLPSCCSAHTGLLKQSKIGEGNVESGAVSVNERRTSSTVLLEPTVVEQNAELQPMVVQLQAKAQKLLDIGLLSV